uniref:AB hydrolase-1 domain-containing protein n=1 Tax=Kalanchoe fedtschenkoi TaxID=63787 RepID=A0A7N0USW7_KALFE
MREEVRTRKVSAASARSHTRGRGSTRASSPHLSSAMFVPIALAVVAGLLGWGYKASRPPPPKICGSPGGPPVTSPRVKLSDGRHLAYREVGVPKEKAEHKIIIIHGYGDSKDLFIPVSKELLEDLKIYILLFDRAGYGESDPYPERSVKTEAYDIQEIADILQLGPKFYLLGMSLGAYPVYSCLKYIPHRLAGASLVVPFVHYWWSGLPRNLSNAGFNKMLDQNKWTFRVAHYTPQLIYLWMTQKVFPTLSLSNLCARDKEMFRKLSENPNPGQEKVNQQGDFESFYRDMIVGFSNWEFSPLNLTNPFPENKGSVHIWQGYDDRAIPYEINRYIVEKLPWIQYHEVPDGGHMIFFDSDLCEDMLKSLVGR